MAIFRLTEVSDNSRATKPYWDARVTRDWATPYHGLYGAKDMTAMDARNIAVLRDLIENVKYVPIRVLECACGYGRYAAAIAERCNEYIGIDLADLNIVEARRQAALTEHPPGSDIGTTEFFVADMATFQSEEKFDLIFMVAAWSSIEQSSAEILAHLRTLLKPGGKLAVFEETLYMVLDK